MPSPSDASLSIATPNHDAPAGAFRLCGMSRRGVAPRARQFVNWRDNAQLQGLGNASRKLGVPDIIASHCPGTRARHDFVRACIGEDWDDVRAMVEGMLAEPWLLRGRQEVRLRQFLELV